MSTWHFWNLFEEYLEMQYYLFLFWPKFVFHLLQPILSIFMTEPCIGKLHTMKRKKYVMKHPQNINRSECIMKCALESTSTKHCSFISATPVHTFTDADLPEPCTDPHIKPTKNSSEMIWIGFCKSYEKEAKHCKTCYV